ncbi:mucin-4-like isoform X1 [Pseudopipra pipra]|uniref:mucin-4-like isoform X1 n=1 Tax=Pseudopipra pipra TaxID=415032 RepID=UPI0031386B23
MGTRGWTLSTFLGCCVWILHGLGAAAAPVTTEGPFTVGTAFPITAENEGPSALVTGTADTSTTAADAEIDESIFTRSPLSSTFPPGTELDSFVTVTSEYGSTVPTLMNVTKPLNTSQGIEGGLAASTTAITAAAITAQHPAVTPEAEHEVIEATPDPTLDINPDVKEDIPAAVTRGEEDIDLTTGNMSYPTTPPPAETWVPQPTAGSPASVSVTVLPSQGLTTAMGAVEEVVTLSASVQSGANANSLSPSPSTEELLTTQQGGVVSRVEGTNPETAEEMAPAAEESPLASESGDAGDTTNGEFSTAGSSHLPPESPVMSETVGNPGEPSFLPGHAVPSPDASLAPSTGNGDGQGVSSGSALSPAASEAPVAPEETEDTATTLLAPEVPTYAQSDMNLPTVATVLPTGDVGAVGLDNPSLQPDPWQTFTGEQPPLLPDALTDTPSAPGAAYPLPGAEANTLSAADGAAETPSSPDLTTAPEAPMSPSLGESQSGGMPDGPPQESDGPDAGLSSDSDAASPAPFVPDGLAWPTAGVQGQGAQGAEDMAQAGGPGDGSPYTDTQSDISLSDTQPSASSANNGELLAGGTGDLASAGQSPPSALGDGTGAGDASALGEASSPGSVPPSSAGMEPDLSGAEGPVDLPSESASGPGAVYPLPGTVSGPASETETSASPNLNGAQGAPGSPSFGGLQPWGTATGAPQGAGLPGAEGPDSGLSSSGDAPSSAVHGLVGPPSPALEDQLGTNLGLPAAGGPGVGTAEQALEGAGSGIDSEPSLSSTAGSGMAAGIDQLPGEGSSSDSAFPSDVVAAPSVSRGDEAGPISGAPLGPDSLSSASPASETGPGLGLVEGAESAGDVAQAGNPESPYIETNPSAFNPQQDPANTRELPAGETGALVNTEQSPPLALGDGTGAGDAPALGEASSPGSVPPSSAGMEPNLSGAEGPVDLPSESASGPGAIYPLPGTVSGPASETETPASPNLNGAQGAPGSPSFGGSQPWGTATGAPQGAGLPGAEGPDSGLSSSGDAPSSAVHGLVGPPSPALEDHRGTNLGLPAAGGPGVGTAEQALEGAGSGIDSEPSLSSTAGSGMAAGIDQLPGEGSSSGSAFPSNVVAAPSVSRGDEAGPISGAAPGPDSLSSASPASETGPGLGLVEGAESAGDVAQAGNPESPYIETNPSAFSPQEDQLPGAGSSSGPALPSGEVAASSVSDPASQSALGGEGNAPEALQPSLDAGPGVPAAAGEGASEMAGNGESMGQSQAPTGNGPTGSGTPDEDMGDVLQSVSSSSSTEGSSLLGRTDEAVSKASLPGADGADGGLNTGLGATGPQEAPVSVPGIQSSANIELSDGKQSQVDVVQVPGGASVNGASSPGASLVPVAPDNSGVSDSTATSTAASLLLPEHGLSSGLAPNGDTHSAPGTQSGSRPLVPGAPSGPAGESGGISWSLEDELASGMPAPLGEASPHAPISPNTSPVLPSAPQRGNAAEGVSVSPGLSTPLAARESIVGSSAGGKGELGASVPGSRVLLLPPCQPGSTGAPSRDANSPVPGKASAVLPRVMAGQGDVARLLPSVTGSGADMETPTHSLPQGSPGLPGLPLTGITAGSTGSKIPGPGPTGGSPSAALHPILGSELTTSSANGAPATAGSSLPRAFPGQGGSQGGFPATACPGTSCSPAPADPAPQTPLLRGREVLPRPGTSTVTSHTSSPVVPAPPGRPAAAPTLLPSPAVPAVPLYGYGARENDREYVERRVDFNSPLFKPETGFPFGRTLRDSLYFTDNGQIVFPASEKGIFTYPNPPSGGFNGHEEVPMIAVFWDNADFSSGVGTTFYQEFSTLNTAKPPFVRDVEAKVRQYMRSSYSAAWTLKITWEKAPVYASRSDTRKTITYQAILTTDGFRSYILMLYQDRGMQWDYTRLAATNVLIGYTSGDGFYYNDDLSKRPPAVKYRPDQFRGYNTDLRGLWIYKLESRVGINYRLKCLAWTGQQQEPRAWSQGLPTCPCSLQQGQQDPRFKSSRGGRWAARVSMLHSASPNQHGAGVRCLYDSQNQLIEGRQERYWRSSRQASPYRDQELKLYDWCCNRAGSAHLCARYSEKRPKIGCDGYQSPGTDSSEEIERDSDEETDGDDE